MMYCHKAKITRIKQGKETPTLGLEEIFTSVFDTTNPKSATESLGTADYCLSLLKDVIESDFKEIFEAMADCWTEKDYKTFVLTLLGRARQGASSEKQKKMPLVEMPSVQMSKIFENAVADYNIATYICKLPNYLDAGGFCGGDIFEFIETIQSNVLSKYVSQQNEEIYKKISEFNHVLDAYAHFLCMITSAISQKYGMMLNLGVSYDEIIKTMDSDVAEIKTNLGKRTSMKEGGTNEPSVSMLEGELNQLSFIRSVLSAHKQLCKLFGEICPGKTILAF